MVSAFFMSKVLMSPIPLGSTNALQKDTFCSISLLIDMTPGLGEKNESAPKLGVWVGWQMVKRYMQENKGISLQQLMAEKDPQKILNMSKYKPK
jgi:hypothetical protein